MPVAEPSLSARTRSRRVTPPLPAGRKPTGTGEWKTVDTPALDGSSAWSAYIAYTNEAGRYSERRFTCRSIQASGRAIAVYGYCHERESFISLRVDRIEQLICCATATAFDPMVQFEVLRLRGVLGVKDRALPHLARLLVFLARCDGTYHPLEKEALEELFGRYALRFGGNDETVERCIAGSRELAPTGEDADKALEFFRKVPLGRDLCRFVLDAGADMIDADGRHAPEEIEWAIEISSALKSIAGR